MREKVVSYKTILYEGKLRYINVAIMAEMGLKSEQRVTKDQWDTISKLNSAVAEGDKQLKRIVDSIPQKPVG